MIVYLMYMLLCSDGISQLILFCELKHNAMSFIKIKKISTKTFRCITIKNSLLNNKGSSRTRTTVEQQPLPARLLFHA